MTESNFQMTLRVTMQITDNAIGKISTKSQDGLKADYTDFADFDELQVIPFIAKVRDFLNIWTSPV